MCLLCSKVLNDLFSGFSWLQFKIKGSAHALNASSQSLIFINLVKPDFASWVKNARTYIGDTIHTAHKFIYQGGLGINSVAVERVLKSESWTPTLVRTCQDSMTMLQTNH